MSDGSEEGVRFDELPALPAQPDQPPAAAAPAVGVGEVVDVPSSAEPAAGDMASEVEIDPPTPAAVPVAPLPAAAAPAAADPLADFETKAADELYYYDENARAFWVRNDAGEWVDLSEGGFKRHLKKQRGLRDKPNPGKAISPLDEEVSRVEKNCRVSYAGPLAGHRAGIRMIAGRRVLVPVDPVLIEPKEGEWAILEAYFNGLLVGQEPTDDKGGTMTIDQRPYFYGWLRHVVECLRAGRVAPGLALGMAGEPNCGKSFLALILRWLLGGGVGKPYAAMTGQDQFNKDAAEHVLQLVDDENQADTRLDMRQKFASEIKKFVANNEFRLRAMHKDGFAVEVLRRLVVLVNLQGIMVLPPLDGDVDDKLLLFKGYARPAPPVPISMDTPAEQACWPAPMPTRTEEEKERYRDTIRAELPAFLHWLLEKWKIPSEVSGGRFVVRHWHHPAIVAELHSLSPHTRLWDLIVRARVVFEVALYDSGDGAVSWTKRDEWSGTANDLEVLLKKDQNSQLNDSEKREIASGTWLGRRLGLVEKHYGPDVCREKRTATSRRWVLKPRGQDRIGGK